MGRIGGQKRGRRRWYAPESAEGGGAEMDKELCFSSRASGYVSCVVSFLRGMKEFWFDQYPLI